MALARPDQGAWRISVEPVGPLTDFLSRLLTTAADGPVALGVDCPMGLPRAFAALNARGAADFPSFLDGLAHRPAFFEVADHIEDVSTDRPFYPRRGRLGMTRHALAHTLGLPDTAALSRACDRATAERPAGAPVFWTLGANQSGKAAISFWRDVLLPAARAATPVALWPFDGPFRRLLRPGAVAIAETYPADALRQLGLRPIGSKRRQADRVALTPGLRAAIGEASAVPDPSLDEALATGFGSDAAGEDRMDCLIGVLCVLAVLDGRRPDTAPEDPWIRTWEGWVLGQSAGSV